MGKNVILGHISRFRGDIYITDSIPLTTVGKIYKPQLRCDAAARHVIGLLHADLGCPDAEVVVQDGGKRGLRVSVTLPRAAQAAAPAVEQALAAYLFEATVSVA